MNNLCARRPFQHTATYYRKVKFYMRNANTAKALPSTTFSSPLKSSSKKSFQLSQEQSPILSSREPPIDSNIVDCNLSPNNIFNDDNEENYYSVISNEFNDIDNLEAPDTLEEQLPFVQDLQNWALRNRIKHIALNEILKLLSKYDMNYQIPRDARTLLYTPRMVDIHQMGNGEFWYNGLKESLKRSLPSNTILNEIALNFNIDGLPINRSSQHQFWPILANIVNMPQISPMIIAIYCGNTKPPSAQEYFNEFVKELNTILVNGIQINGRVINVKVNAFICDTPARCFIKCVLGFNSYNGCQKCEVKGEYHRKQKHMSYPQTDCPVRTDESFRTRRDPEHHLKSKGEFVISPLERIHNFDMIKDVIIADDLHLFYLGIMKRLLNSWIRGSQNCQFKFFSTQIGEISNWLLQTNSTKPKEIHRAARGLDCFSFWKGTELRTFLLYLGSVILKDYLTCDMYQHFIVFSCAVTICSSKYYIKNKKFLLLADKLFLDFIEMFIDIYGIDSISSNVHNLCHVLDDVKRFGALSCMSSYVFENTLYTIKTLLRHGNRPLAQAAKRLAELSNLSAKATKSKFPLFKRIITDTTKISPKLVGVKSYKKVYLFDGVLLDANGKDDWFLTQREEVVKMYSAYYSENKVQFYGSRLKQISNFFNSPFESRHFHIYMSNSAFHEPTIYSIQDIKCKMFHVIYKEKNIFMPLIHTLDLFNE